MSFKIQNRTLLYEGKPIYEAPEEIWKFFKHPFNEAAVIIYDASPFLPEGIYPTWCPPVLEDKDLQKTINQNILCIAKDGTVVWQVEKNAENAVDFQSISPINEALWGRRIDACWLHIDWNTGKILKLEQHDLKL